MAGLDLAYARALIAAAPLGDVAAAALRRAWPPLGRARYALASPLEASQAARALGRAPPLLAADDPAFAAGHAALFPAAAARMRARAERILDGEIEIFGRSVRVPRPIDWHRDPDGAGRFDPLAPAESIDLASRDPKRLWELARAGHLVELAAAARLDEALRPAAIERIADEVASFCAQNLVGYGIHFASPLECAVRVVHWLAAVELVGGARELPLGFGEQLGAALIDTGRFLARHLEDGGVAPANHLLGDLVGLYRIGLALGEVAEARFFVAQARAGLLRQAVRQVNADGSDFEASTGYHRFVLELLAVAERAARVFGDRLELGPTLHRMFGFVRGILAPDGSEPGIGDSDDARLLPLSPRPPRDHGYLLSLGAAWFSDPRLKPTGATFSEEAYFWHGPPGYRAWRALPSTSDSPSVSYPAGGLHIARAGDDYVALRAGSYGQHGVGGHAHNDQLSLVVYAGGRPLFIDPGTCCYGSDPLLRARYRGTAAHSTLIVDGEEQSPIPPGRPFALPDRARGRGRVVADRGTSVTLAGEHAGYRRLRAGLRDGAVHLRRVQLERAARTLLVRDHLSGSGRAQIELRFHTPEPARVGVSPSVRQRLALFDGRWGAVDWSSGIELGPLDAPRAVLIQVERTLNHRVLDVYSSPRFGNREIGRVISLWGVVDVPWDGLVVVVFLDEGEGEQ